MTNNSNSALGQLKEKLLAASQADIAMIVKEAQDEAMKEAKTLLKERMLEAILRDAIAKVNRLSSESGVLVADEQQD